MINAKVQSEFSIGNESPASAAHRCAAQVNRGAFAWRLAAAVAAGALFVGAPLLAAPSLVPVATADTDSDGDGAEDGWELHHGTDGADADTDDDLLKDGREYFETKTNPTLDDTDGDGMFDGREVLRPAPTDPLDSDTDNDGLSDGQEVDMGSDPLVSNLRPIPKRTPEPGRPNDRDSDGLLDDDETNVYGTNPDKADTDEDGPDDGQEVFDGTDPLDSNSHL